MWNWLVATSSHFAFGHLDMFCVVCPSKSLVFGVAHKYPWGFGRAPQVLGRRQSRATSTCRREAGAQHATSKSWWQSLLIITSHDEWKIHMSLVIHLSQAFCCLWSSPPGLTGPPMKSISRGVPVVSGKEARTTSQANKAPVWWAWGVPDIMLFGGLGSSLWDPWMFEYIYKFPLFPFVIVDNGLKLLNGALSICNLRYDLKRSGPRGGVQLSCVNLLLPT